MLKLVFKSPEHNPKYTQTYHNKENMNISSSMMSCDFIKSIRQDSVSTYSKGVFRHALEPQTYLVITGGAVHKDSNVQSSWP